MLWATQVAMLFAVIANACEAKASRCTPMVRRPLIRPEATFSGPRAQRSGVHRRASQWLANAAFHPHAGRRNIFVSHLLFVFCRMRVYFKVRSNNS